MWKQCQSLQKKKHISQNVKLFLCSNNTLSLSSVIWLYKSGNSSRAVVQPRCWLHPWSQHTGDISWDKAPMPLAGRPSWAVLPTLKWVAHSVMTLRWQWLGMCVYLSPVIAALRKTGRRYSEGGQAMLTKVLPIRLLTSQYRPNNSLDKLCSIHIIPLHYLKIQRSAPTVDIQ